MDYGYSAPCKPADFEKDPDATILLEYFWARDLDGDTIDTSEFLFPDGLSGGTEVEEGTKVTVLVSGGDCGRNYRVTNRITTDGGLTLDKTLRVLVREQ